MIREPDRQRWARPESYRPDWAERARLAAEIIPDGASVFEIGVGAGWFRDHIKSRCNYLGADLEPLDPATLRLNLDSDSLPPGPFDFVVCLGVLEYLHYSEQAVGRMCRSGRSILCTYCFPRTPTHVFDAQTNRAKRGWVNCLSRTEIAELFGNAGFNSIRELPYNSADDFEQILMHVTRT